ncbi:SCO family protein [Parafilimonas sp.]|uniref:SCO family protein n=1 Tax=Parafilimonas sp. TaxID=1969739 RepID=UPI0039E5EF60
MNKKVVGYIIFFAALTIGFLFAVFAGTDKWKAKSPVISFVKPFVFINQDSKPFTEKNMAGKVCAVNFFFTTCKGVCPIMNNNLNKVYSDFENEKDFMIVSHTCDPETDSAAQLKHYADSMKVDTRKWVFLTGRKDSLYLAARNSYLIDDPNNNVGNINDQFLHSQFVALVDRFGNVRGQVYDALKPEDLKLMETNIRALLKETTPPETTSNGTSFAN